MTPANLGLQQTKARICSCWRQRSLSRDSVMSVVVVNSFFPITVRPDALGFGMVVQRIQNIEQTMRMPLFDYKYLVDRLPV
jgi:hypothetical protein